VNQDKQDNAAQIKGRVQLLAVLAVCAFPIVASYLTYFVIKPTGRTNYGALIDPRKVPIPPALTLTALDGKPATLDNFKGKWIFLQIGNAGCAAACQKQLFTMRQLRLMQGKEMDRIERVWLVTDSAALDPTLLKEYAGTQVLRAPEAVLRAWLPLDELDKADKADDHFYLIDPIGNLMMRFPKGPRIPARLKKDIAKLLKASGIG